jgi:hypothetical protein
LRNRGGFRNGCGLRRASAALTRRKSSRVTLGGVKGLLASTSSAFSAERALEAATSA